MTEPRPLRLSVVVPVRNEQDNIAPLVAEIEAALAGWDAAGDHAAGNYEIIYVNDGSTDRTPQVLSELAAVKPHLRFITHRQSCGQSASVRTGVRAARGVLVATMDGDGQNDPAFLPQMVAVMDAAKDAGGAKAGLVQGQRLGRQDTGFKKFQSRVANGIRSRVLKDGTRDTGCGLKLFRREAYLALPYFDALHRFMPALMRREGYDVLMVDVKDRPRLTGVSNYGFFDRLWVGILDLSGVWWLIRRRKRVPDIVE